MPTNAMLQFNTDDFHKKFSTLTTKGACGVNLLPDYWKSRSNAEIPSLALNVFALLVSAFLSWRLMKVHHKRAYMHLERLLNVHSFRLSAGRRSSVSALRVPSTASTTLS